MLAPHQSEASARVLELLDRRRGAVLADDVGLGKSFVAAEVMRRWGLSRDDAIEVIVPAALVPQWRETLAVFGVEARIATHDALAGAGLDPFAIPRLVVVDEAHAFRNPRTKRYAGLARRTASAAVLLVTATPICNRIGDLYSLLRLIAADDLLADGGVPSIGVAFESSDSETIARIVDAIVIRRERGVLVPSLDFGVLARHVIRHEVPDLPLLDQLRFPLLQGSAIVRLFLRRRLESSTAALAESLRRQRRFYQRALSALACGRALPKRDYRRAFAHEEDREMFQEVLFWELFAPPAIGVDARELHDEMQKIDSLLSQIASCPDGKASLLAEVVRASDVPLLLFTGSAATARSLRDALSGIRRCGLVTSRERSREAVLSAFRAGRLDAVISTDMAAEGLNLQRAGLVIHYDLPWNPVKLDQRNGRAHRIGQRRGIVRAVYFIPASRDTGIMAALARKNRARRRTLGARNGEPSLDYLPTLRPWLPSSAAVRRLVTAGLNVPEELERVHKAGIELLLEQAGRGERGLAELVAIVSGDDSPRAVVPMRLGKGG